MGYLYLKEQLTQKLNFPHHLLTFMLMESQVKCRRPQNISGASQKKKTASQHSAKQLK